MELYVHLPFCARKCRYCDFASYAGQEFRMAEYVDLLLKEAEDRGRGQPVETVYLGGGTPSLLPPTLLSVLLNGLRNIFEIPPEAEFTSEANPGTLTPEWLDAAVAGGVNRLSLGMQARQDALLQMLGRIHRYPEVEQSVQLARQAGIRNLSLDLMFGLPGQDLAQWRESLEAALSLRPQHLSCYSLIPEEGTPLQAELNAGALTLPPEELEREMYRLAEELSMAAGMRQYEISSFALPGYECRHNLGYWRPGEWLGLGAAAASMQRDDTGTYAWIRQVNPPELDDYQRLVQGETALRTWEEITWREAAFEMMMLGLRTTQGVEEAHFTATFGMTVRERFPGERLEKLIEAGLLRCEDGFWRLSRKGMDLQNTVLLELMEE